MQAIVTKYIPATNTKPARIKAWCERGSITISYNDGTLGDGDRSLAACRALCRKFADEDLKQYGTPIESNPWMRPVVQGGLPKGVNAGDVFVFLP